VIIHEIKQGGDDWKALRCGKFTASNFDKLFMGKSTKGYQDAINTVVYERLTGDVPESFESNDMKRGTELEPEARLRYELETFNKVETVGFVEMDEWVGCSPDGLIGEDGSLEIKCPKYNTFIHYAMDHRKAYEEYEAQVQGQLFVTGRKWVDLFIYHPKLEPLIDRVDRDEKFINGIRVELEIAIMKAKERIKHIRGTK
jgi:hypothetical protein